MQLLTLGSSEIRDSKNTKGSNSRTLNSKFDQTIYKKHIELMLNMKIDSITSLILSNHIFVETLWDTELFQLSFSWQCVQKPRKHLIQHMIVDDLMQQLCRVSSE